MNTLHQEVDQKKAEIEARKAEIEARLINPTVIAVTLIYQGMSELFLSADNVLRVLAETSPETWAEMQARAFAEIPAVIPLIPSQPVVLAEVQRILSPLLDPNRADV